MIDATIWDNLRGNEHAKRAVEVALAGGHSVLFVGRAGNGQAELAAAMYVDTSHRVRAQCLEPCPCGELGSPVAECTCTAEAVLAHRLAHRAMIEGADLVVEIITPRARDMFGPPRDLVAEMCARLSTYAKHAEPVGLEASARNLLTAAYEKLGFTADRARSVLRVATTIARMDHAAHVTAAAVAEAVQYAPRRGG